MVVRRFAAAVGGASLAAALALVALPAYAAGPTDVYVVTPANGGVDNPDCSFASPCATVPAAIFAVASEGTVHVGAGTFDGELRPGALTKSVTIAGAGPAATILTATTSGDGFVLEVGEETTTLSDLQIHGGDSFTDVVVDGTGVLVADRVDLSTAGCNLVVVSGSATLTDSTVEDGGHAGCATPLITPPAEISQAGGVLSLVRTEVLAAEVGVSGVDMSGGTLTVDRSLFDDSAHDVTTNNSSGIKVSGGAATITRSTFHGWGFQAVRVAGGAALVNDATFQGNLVGVNVDSGSATVVRSTFHNELGSLTGPVSVAGSVLDSMDGGPPLTGIKECNGVIVDLGYNLSSDNTCGFTQATSHESVTDLGLDTGLADRGGPVPTVAILTPSSAVDSIPVGATYGVSATPLCPATSATDLRGVPRPQAGSCDAGSFEMAGTTTTLQAPATAKPLTAVTLNASVVVPDVGVAGLGLPAGSVTFSSGGQVLCQHVLLTSGAAACTTSALGAGSRAVSATFASADGSTLHGSVSSPVVIKVGTKPAFTSSDHTRFRVGKRKTFTVHASGSPRPRITLVKGKLPAGLTFHAGTGSATISGKAKASAAGTHKVTLEATNLRGTVKQVLRIVVKR